MVGTAATSRLSGEYLVAGDLLHTQWTSRPDTATLTECRRVGHQMTIDITGRDQWQAWQDGVLPPVERVRDGVWSIPVPIPDNPMRYVLVYALESRDGVALIDAGWDDDRS